MRIELIAPASEDSALLPRMGLGILAALTPPEHEVIYSDDLARPFRIPNDLKQVDLVGISVDSKTARRAYEIAWHYRQRGIRVVMGGIHPTAMPEEAALFADAVVMGEAEELWPQVLRDAQAGQLQQFYRGPWPELKGHPPARRDLFRSRRYIPFQTVQTMRGCPYPCEFCSVSTANGSTFRFRPVDEVIAELKQLGPRILFADDNVMVHRKYSGELFEAMKPLKKQWVGQCSLAAVRRLENVQLMAESGCVGLFIGFESVDEATLRATGKRQNRPEEYREVVQCMREHGILSWGSFVFGFDDDSPDVFSNTVEVASDMGLTMASFAMLTPYPGTKLYQRLKEEGRLTDERWWLRTHHDAEAPYFLPKNMSREQLREGWLRAWEEFYSGARIRQRFSMRSSGFFRGAAFLGLNFAQRQLVHRKLLGGEQRFRSRDTESTRPTIDVRAILEDALAAGACPKLPDADSSGVFPVQLRVPSAEE